MPKFSYQKIKDIFEEKMCQILTTEEEFNTQNMSAKFSKFNIISSCGHESRNCRFKEFKSIGVGVLCQNCSKLSAISKLKENGNTTINIEKLSIEILKRYISIKFDIKIMNECTKADIAIRLKQNQSEDLWFPIQLKCRSKPTRTVFKFSMLKKNYDDMFIVGVSLEPVKFWVSTVDPFCFLLFVFVFYWLKDILFSNKKHLFHE